MKIKRSQLEKIVREELANFIREELSEADKPEKSDGKKEDQKDKKKPSVVGADQDNKKDIGNPTPNNTAPTVGSKKASETPDGGEKSAAPHGENPADEVDLGDDPNDGDVAAGVESDKESSPGGDISDELVGKRIQSVSYEPKSKMISGAQEIVIQFDEMPHPLKIVITKSGQVRYMFKNVLHNML